MKTEEYLKTTITLDEAKKFAINLMLCAGKASSLMGETLKPYDISLQQFNVLRILRGQKGKPANLSTIQERMVNKMSNTTRLVDKLITKQLVDRCVCEENRRKVEIIITTKGLELLETLDPLVAAAEKNFTSTLEKEELIEVNKILEKISN